MANNNPPTVTSPKTLKSEEKKAITKKQNKKPSYCGVIIVTVLISFVISLIVGFAASGLGGAFYQKIFKKELPVVTQTVKIEEESATIDAVKKVQPAVVSIVVTQDLKNLYQQYNLPYEQPFFKEFFKEFGIEPPTSKENQPQNNEDIEKQKIGGGTGFIISSDGLILTNRHVVSYDSAAYTAITDDGKKYDAKILAIDPTNDVAVVKIDANNLPVVELGDSGSLQIGQTVIAIGYALGEYHNTVTKGVVSGLGRAITAGGIYGEAVEQLENIIQTDAAVNPGNSGGPLINLTGQVIGINTAMDVQGQLIGFAIPINDAKDDVESVKKEGKIVKPFIGIRYQIITKVIAKANNLPYEYGALVIRGSRAAEVAVIPGSPADKAGITENDIILELNGKKITEKETLAKLLRKYKVGDEITLKIYHKGEEKEVKLKLEERK
jgi:S1-C subfamily serine protease